MGGEGLTGATQAAVTDYVNWRPHVDLPNKGADNAIIAEGRSLFYGVPVADLLQRRAVHGRRAALDSWRQRPHPDAGWRRCERTVLPQRKRSDLA